MSIVAGSEGHKKVSAAERGVLAAACVGLCGKTSPERVNAGLNILSGLGVSGRLFMPGQPCEYLSGSDEDRLEAFRLAASFCAGFDRFGGPTTPAGLSLMLAARGGYGAFRLASIIKNIPSGLCFMGFSDATAMVPVLARDFGWRCWHGPNLSTLCQLERESLIALEAFLSAPRAYAPVLNDLEVLVSGDAEGDFLCMNLSVLCSLLGTAAAPDLKGLILGLEDTNEAEYRLDRMIHQLLSQNGAGKPAGLVLGDLGRPLAGDLRETIVRVCEARGIPLFSGLPAGHGGRNVPLPQYVPAAMESARCSVSFQVQKTD